LWKAFSPISRRAALEQLQAVSFLNASILEQASHRSPSQGEEMLREIKNLIIVAIQTVAILSLS